MTKTEKAAVNLLCAIAPKKTTLSITQKLLVDDGTATVDSLDERLVVGSHGLFGQTDVCLVNPKLLKASGNVAASRAQGNLNDFPECGYHPKAGTHDWQLLNDYGIHPDLLISWLSQCAPHAATDESRACLTGIYIDKKEGAVVATDGYILFAVEDAVIATLPHSVLIPAHVAARLVQIQKSFTVTEIWFGTCEGATDKHYIECTFAKDDVDGVYYAKLFDVDELYPDWRKIVPDALADGREGVLVSPSTVDQLRAALKTLIPFANPKTKLVRLQGPGTLAVYNPEIDKYVRFIDTPTFGPELGEKKIILKTDAGDQETVVSDPFEIGIDASLFDRLLSQFLEGAFISWDVRVGYEIRCIVIRHKDSTGLIMPLRIKDEDFDFDIYKYPKIDLGVTIEELCS